MKLNEYTNGRIFVGKLPYQCDLLDSITALVGKKRIKAGHINLIGAVTTTRIGYFDIVEKEYKYHETTAQEKPFEIAGCSGNISLKKNSPFVHLHIVFSDEKGNCHGGHLMSGTKVYACEFIIQELLGDDLIRTLDDETGLYLWND